MTNEEKIGVVFTPREWAQFAIQKFGIFDRWIKGDTIFDPTIGSGDLLLALIHLGIEKGYSIKSLPTDRLFGNELNLANYSNAINRFQTEFNLDLGANLTNKDLLQLPSHKFDIILGNPPWINFNDLPELYKHEIKDRFHEFDLIDNNKSLLLGGSRIDLAALIIQRSMKDFLSEGGDAYFFMPLSLLLNDGAHTTFRNFQVMGIQYSLVSVHDFGEEKIFKNVATRYGLVHFQRDDTTNYPIEYFRMENKQWQKYQAKPLLNANDPLSIYKFGKPAPLDGFKPIVLPKKSAPRQGINTCGANSIFFFDEFESINSQSCIVNGQDKLPKEFIHPLLVSSNFSETTMSPQKWVLLPYSNSGKPLLEDEIAKHPLLQNYLLKHKTKLRARKGTMIRSWIERGIWWSLLGVGPYNFAPYKVVWEAYGKKTFRPKLVLGNWQVNQSLQCYVPTDLKKEAARIHKALKNPGIEEYLLSMKMEGTMNWAQPGKIKKLIQFEE